MSFIDSAIKANQKIHKMVQTRDESFFEHHCTGAGGDRSLGIDLAAEEIFFSELKQYGFFYSEESGLVGEGEKKMVLDPIDGSANFASMMPYYGTSIALFDKEGKPEAAVICNLANQDVFIKKDGYVKIGKLYGSDFRYLCQNKNSEVGIIERAYLYPKISYEMANACIKFRSPGAMALSLAYCFEVNFLLFFGKPREFDVAAGLYIVEELYHEVTDSYILVSKDKQMFDKLHAIVKATI